VGFLNPWLYESGNEFLVDIVSGAGRGCDGINHQSGRPVKGGSIIPGAFWNATAGWDAVTGLGIPDFQKLLVSSIGTDDGDDDDAARRRAGRY
jgi:tripeptidyl-peptidase I